ncbi:unnamed protein product [Meganyctiphanes norvegica]|uniref:Peptidase metallopeptidase domain-containing protein n=1 Tax=Meganyctiphanes norvegica TaxID=48144 RepID=A0AAV2Q2W8_MEGNR
MYVSGRIIPVLVAWMCALSCSEAAPASTENNNREKRNTHNKLISGTTSALLYLSKYGYLDPSATNPKSGALLSEDAVRNSIREFQAFANLNQTGDLDDETIKMMNTPRCGVKDKVGYGSVARRKRYALQGSRWKVRHLTYQITQYPRASLDKTAVDRDISQAFKVWEEVTDLTFSPATSSSAKVHIEIRFEKGEHGDGDPFDGIGGTLAHAYFPIYGGDAHFDDSEKWTIDSYRGTNLFQVAAHELGHSLGLSHSDERNALMAAFYRGYIPSFSLHKDDIQAIQALYGENKGGKPPPSIPSTGGGSIPPKATGLCQDSKLDAIVTLFNNATYVFKGSKYWKLNNDGVHDGYPKSISTNWDGLPSNIDAAFTWSNGKTYFFKGSTYYRFSNGKMDNDYPKSISKGFAGIPNNIDAAYVWSGNGKIYFTKGSQYWRFDPEARPPVMRSYPKDISNWVGLPANLDDALHYSNGYTYFFKGGQYYRFNDRAFRVDSADPPFPRPTGYWWFGCPDSSQIQEGSSHSDNLPSDFSHYQSDFVPLIFS